MPHPTWSNKLSYLPEVAPLSDVTVALHEHVRLQPNNQDIQQLHVALLAVLAYLGHVVIVELCLDEGVGLGIGQEHITRFMFKALEAI